MRYILLAFALFIGMGASAQSGAPPAGKEPKKITVWPQEMPKAKYDYNKYISDNVHYPDSAKKYGVEGRVIVQFVVNDDGTISDAQVVRGIGAGCDEEALRVIVNMPQWIPGKKNGVPVNVNFTMPILFKLQ